MTHTYCRHEVVYEHGKIPAGVEAATCPGCGQPVPKKDPELASARGRHAAAARWAPPAVTGPAEPPPETPAPTRRRIRRPAESKE